MACRNNARCEEARAELMQRGLPGTAECMQVHLDNMTSVRAFAANVVQKLHRAKRQLRVLVNNAGVCNSYRSVMTYNKIVHKSHACAPHPATGVMAVPPDPHDGLDGHLRPNHFGPFLLTCCLANTLDHKGARIVNVGSRAHFQGTLVLDTKHNSIQGTPRGWYYQYARSKLCNLLWTLELQRRLQESAGGGGNTSAHNVTATCISPGRVATNIFHSIPGCVRPIVQALARACFQTPAQGARTVVYAATAPELHGKQVLYYHDCKPAPVSAAGCDGLLAKQLWEVSEAFVGLTSHERAGLLYGGGDGGG